MDKKPKMYQNKVNKEFHNNKTVFISYDNDNSISNDYNKIFDSNIIRNKIDKIINSNNFIYSKLVHIVIGNDTITRKIVGIYNNNLVTIDNEYIPIASIKDIYIWYLFSYL